MKRDQQEATNVSVGLGRPVSVFQGETRELSRSQSVAAVLAGFGPRLVQRNSNRVKISKAKPRRTNRERGEGWGRGDGPF